MKEQNDDMRLAKGICFLKGPASIDGLKIVPEKYLKTQRRHQGTDLRRGNDPPSPSPPV